MPSNTTLSPLLDDLMTALRVLPAEATEILVLSGDVPLVDPELLAELDRQGRLSEGLLERMLEEHRLFRVSVFESSAHRFRRSL